MSYQQEVVGGCFLLAHPVYTYKVVSKHDLFHQASGVGQVINGFTLRSFAGKSYTVQKMKGRKRLGVKLMNRGHLTSRRSQAGLCVDFMRRKRESFGYQWLVCVHACAYVSVSVVIYCATNVSQWQLSTLISLAPFVSAVYYIVPSSSQL